MDQPTLPKLGRSRPKARPKDKREEIIRRKISRSLMHFGFIPRHEQDFGPTHVTRPDIFGVNFFGPDVVIEVKGIASLVRQEPHFDLDQIRDRQRNWLDWATFEMNAVDSTFIAIGTTFLPEECWLIPWAEWVNFEKVWLNQNPGNLHIPIGTIREVFEAHKLVSDISDTRSWEGFWDLEHTTLRWFPRGEPALWKDVRVSYRFEKEDV